MLPCVGANVAFAPPSSPPPPPITTAAAARPLPRMRATLDQGGAVRVIAACTCTILQPPPSHPAPPSLFLLAAFIISSSSLKCNSSRSPCSCSLVVVVAGSLFPHRMLHLLPLLLPTKLQALLLLRLRRFLSPTPGKAQPRFSALLILSELSRPLARLCLRILLSFPVLRLLLCAPLTRQHSLLPRPQWPLSIAAGSSCLLLRPRQLLLSPPTLPRQLFLLLSLLLLLLLFSWPLLVAWSFLAMRRPLLLVLRLALIQRLPFHDSRAQASRQS